MTPDETPRGDLGWMAWAMREHTRLIAVAEELWAQIDDPGPIETFQVVWQDYNNCCDRIDVLEAIPNCVWKGHPTSIAKDANGNKWAWCALCGWWDLEAPPAMP